MPLGDADDVFVYFGICDEIAFTVGLRKSLPVVERIWLRHRDPVPLRDADHVSVYIRVCDEVPFSDDVSVDFCVGNPVTVAVFLE